MVGKTLHRKLNIEQDEPHYNPRVNTETMRKSIGNILFQTVFRKITTALPNICIPNDHEYIPFVVNTIPSLSHSSLYN